MITEKRGDDSDFKFKGDDKEGKAVKSTEGDRVGGWVSKHKKGEINKR